MGRAIERLLSLQRGDLGRGALLFSYLFFVMATYVIGKSARAALFLDQFHASKLSYAEIAIAVLVGPVAVAYVIIARRVALRNLLLGSLVLYASNCAVFWYLALHFGRQLPWLYTTFYVWVGVYGVLAPAQVWTLANFVLTTREAKRVFGVVGSGAISGGIVAGWLTKYCSTHFGVESLLLIMAVFLGVSTALVLAIWWRQRAALQEAPEVAGANLAEGSVDLRQSLKMIVSSRYLLAICAVICMCSLVTASARWQFTAVAKEFIPSKDALAAFLGDFNFYAGIACLLSQLLFTSRFLRRFGIGPALFVLPLTLLLGTTGLLIWGSLLAANLMRGGDQVLRYSIDKSTVELLFLPIPSNVKIQVKSFIDVVVWRLGDGVSGIAVALFADQLKWTPQRVSWVNITFIAGWLLAAFMARRQYVATLRECILKHRLDSERASAPVLDRSTLNIFADSLQPTDSGKLLYALSLFEVGRQQAAHPAVRELLHHPDPEVRKKALSILAGAGDRTILPQVERMLQDPHLDVRTEALLYLSHHTRIDPLTRLQQLGDFADFSIRSSMVAFLARRGETQNLDAARLMLDAMVNELGPEGQRTRLEAARLIGALPDEFDAQLRRLLADEDVEVTRHAIRAVGGLHKRRLVLKLLDRLGDPRLTADVDETLAMFGDRIVGTLRDHLSDAAIPLEIRREIPTVLARIGTPSAERALVDNLLESDTFLRFRILSALNKIHQQHPEIGADTQMIETVLAAEILGHYRSYQILGTLGGNLDSEEPVARALRESMNQEMERIFRLLSILHPQYDFHSAYVGLQSDKPVVHANALEFLDNVLKPQLRAVLVPLLDAEVTVPERVRLANSIVGAKVKGREDAIAALVGSDDPWLKSCGAYAIGTLGLNELEPLLDECLAHPDPLLRETARWAKLRLAEAAKAATA
jgi:AAA family ATP:ADP antiporter